MCHSSASRTTLKNRCIIINGCTTYGIRRLTCQKAGKHFKDKISCKFTEYREYNIIKATEIKIIFIAKKISQKCGIIVLSLGKYYKYDVIIILEVADLKIEKISDNKIRILITASDLKDRDIEINDLYRDNSKARSLFWDIIYQAYIEQNFDVDNSRLIVEVSPFTSDSFVVIITRIPNCTVSRKIISEKTSLKNIYSFDDFEDIISLCKRINGSFRGNSILYKYKGKYLIVFLGYLTKKMQAILSEYATKESMSDAILVEYGKQIIESRAIEKLTEYFLRAID